VRPLLAQLGMELRLTLRRGENLLVTIFIPLALLVFFAGILAVPMPGASLEFLVPGLLALAVMSSGMVSLGIATAYERHYGVLKRLIGSPLPRGALLAAKTGATLAVEAVQVALLVGVASLVYGWRPAGSLPLALVVLLVGSLAFAGIGLLMAGTLRAETTLALANGLYLLFLLLGGFILPVEHLPSAVAAVARLLPAGALAEATRAALLGGDVGPPLLLLALWAAGALGLAARTFRAE
jgi:ABC-2 type transport system permease protein